MDESALSDMTRVLHAKTTDSSGAPLFSYLDGTGHIKFSILTRFLGRLNWVLHDVPTGGLKRFVNSDGRPRWSIVFASLRQLRRDTHGRDFESCGVPSWLSEEPYSSSNGFSGCQISYDDEPPQYQPQCQMSWFKFVVGTMKGVSYHWDEMTFVSLWRDGGHMAFFCFDIPDFLEQKFTTDLTSIYDLSLFDNPYAVHVIIVEAVVQQYDDASWKIRERVRAGEIQRLSDGSRLQHIERAIIFSIETLTVAVSTVRDMFAQHAEFVDEWKSVLSNRVLIHSKNTAKSLGFQLRMLENHRTRNESLAARLRIQKDDQRAEIMNTLVRMNYLSQNMSRSYGSILFLLLPGIFVSTLLSTDVVQYGREDASYSISATTLWFVITIPLTLLGMALGLWLPTAQVTLRELWTGIEKSAIRIRHHKPINQFLGEREAVAQRSIQV